MGTIRFATTNAEKVQVAEAICVLYDYGVELVQLDIDEIQGEDPETIIRDKAQRAYKACGKPVVVSDDSWGIHALGGFPGPYMKSVNHWFSPEDFIALMAGRKDRRITLYQYLAYHDGKDVTIFHSELHGEIVKTPRGSRALPPVMQVTALDNDAGKTISEVFDTGRDMLAARYSDRREAWHELMDWLVGAGPGK